MVSSNGKRILYRAYIPGMKIDFDTFDKAFWYVQDRIGKDNRPVIKNGKVVWWNKMFKIPAIINSSSVEGMTKIVKIE